MSSLVNITKCERKKLCQPLQSLQKTEAEGIVPYSFYEGGITLIEKHTKISQENKTTNQYLP